MSIHVEYFNGFVIWCSYELLLEYINEHIQYVLLSSIHVPVFVFVMVISLSASSCQGNMFYTFS